MATVRHRNPVVVRHPITGQYVSLSRGQEIPDGDALVKEYAWAFEDDDTPTKADRVASTHRGEPVDDKKAARKRPGSKAAPVERATANPGEKRNGPIRTPRT